eukprot:ANDGO_04742.mRNA.1 Hybrid signal transduction histidine kinase J
MSDHCPPSASHGTESTAHCNVPKSNMEVFSLGHSKLISELQAFRERLAQLESMERASLQAAELFRLAVEASPTALLMVEGGPNGIIRLANRGSELLFGYTNEQLIGKKIEMLVPDRIAKVHPSFRAEFAKDPKARSMGTGRDLLAKRSDDTEIPVEIGLNPIQTSDGLFVLASIIDITERKMAEERFRLAVEAAPNAMFMVGKDGKIVMVNQQAERMFLYSREELVGQAIEILVPESVRDQHPQFRSTFFGCPVVRAMGKGRELYGQRKDGSIVPVEIGLNPIETAEGMIVLASVIDISERKRMQEERQIALEAGLQADLAKTRERLRAEFLARMSHELRTPANAIIGMTDILIDTELSMQQRDFCQTIATAAQTLVSTINDILDFSKLEAGKMTIEHVSFDLEVLLHECFEMIAPKAQKKCLGLSLVVDGPMPVLVCSDRSRLRQVVLNLLSNAVKFTDSGGILLELQNSLMKANGTRDADYWDIWIVVSDTGIGISDDAQPQLFQPFMQGDSSTTRKYGGTGLGLAISKRIMDAMDGTITFQSNDGRGSRFQIHLQMERCMDKGLPPCDPAVAMTKKSALIVDSCQIDRDAVMKQCHMWGMTTANARSFEEAMEMAKRQATPCDFLIVSLCGNDVAPAVEFVSRMTSIMSCHVLWLLSLNTSSSQVFSRPGQLALSKPVSPSQLLDSLLLLCNDRLSPALETQSTPPSAPGPSNRSLSNHLSSFLPCRAPSPATVYRGKVLLVEDNPVNQKVAILLLQKIGYNVDCANNGQEALMVLEREPYYLVLMDIQMPILDGLAATSRIREQETEFQHVPIIAMTAHAMEGDKEKCLGAGMDDYVSKPIDRIHLLHTLRKWDTPINEVVWMRLLTSMGGDEDVRNQVVAEFLTISSKSFDELRVVVHDKSTTVENVKRIVHRLKGACCSVAACRMHNICRRILMLPSAEDAKDRVTDLCEWLLTELPLVERALRAKIGLSS